MHKKTLVFGIVLGISLTCIGIYTWNTFSKKPTPTTEQTTQQTPPVSTSSAPVGDFDSGDGLTSIQMFEELQRVTDSEEFNRKYITYMTLLRNNEAGMSRLAEEKSNRQELKTAAAQSMEADRAFISNMLLWQRLWGYTDH